ncbi:DDE-type integrase/transposase/recombinase [Bacillus thuringiensis]|nr:DDE-type integrase/transposase/recombinase [Bacillus thuringiensis]
MNEANIKIKGEWCYLYRILDKGGHTLDIQFHKNGIIRLPMSS